MKKSRDTLDSLKPEHRKAIQNLMRSITEKIINDPILLLKEKADRKNIDIYLDVTRKLFKMDETNDRVE